MNPARAMVLLVAAVACVVVFLLMRYPHLRRPQFQGGRAFSSAVSFCSAAVLFALLAWLAFAVE
jgi:hypothetical protein